MSLSTEGYSVNDSVIPIDIINSLEYEISELFKELALSDYGIKQQSFWDSLEDSHHKIKTLRLNNLDSQLSNKNFNELIRNVSNHIDGLEVGNYTYTSSHAFYKAAKIGNETPWHQDPAYVTKCDEIIYDNLTCWIPLDDICHESSHLQFIPKSHIEKSVCHHKRINKNTESALIADVNTNKLEIKSIYCKKGDMVIHKSYVIHKTTRNLSSHPRIALILIFSKDV